MKKFLIAAIFSICIGTFAQAELAKRIDAIISQISQSNVQFSVHVVEAASGRAVYSHNARMPLVPASNMKIIVTAAALKYLGPDYEYKTKVGLCGDTLVVMGSGDPLLADNATDAKYGREVGWIFRDIIAALKRNRITTIGDIIVDSGVFDDQRVHPSWLKKELNRPFACEVSGLNFNGNCIEVTARNIGGKTAVFIEPQTGYVKLINKVVPISKGTSIIGSYRNREPNRIVIYGKCKDKVGPFAVAIEGPATFFGFLLAENLIRAGVDTKGRLIEKAVREDCSLRLLAEYSTPLADCLARCNKDSFGLAAEALVKTIAANSEPGGRSGSWLTGRKLISQYLLELGVEEKEFYIDDGSGLSRQNKLSAYTITKVLFDLYKSDNWTLYRDSLAVGGVDGTIAKYFKERRYKGKILGKTGYIRDVKSFSGICTGEPATGDDYIFSILANNANGQTRTAINDIAKAIIDGK